MAQCRLQGPLFDSRSSGTSRSSVEAWILPSRHHTNGFGWTGEPNKFIVENLNLAVRHDLVGLNNAEARSTYVGWPPKIHY